MIGRRDLFKLVGGGAVVAFAQRRGGGGDRSMPREISAWVHIGGDGVVTVYAGKAEMGQNARTSIAQTIAEELRVPLAQVRTVLGDTDLTPYDAGTFGSRTTPYLLPQIRLAGAAARELLIDMAAAKWSVNRTGLSAVDGRVVNAKTGASIGFGELTEGKKLLKTISGDVAIRKAAEWKVAGTSAAKLNARDIVTGRHQYPSDIRREGMLIGKVLRAPAYQTRLLSVNGPAGMVRDGDFVGVAAATEADAAKALAAVKAQWSETPAQPSSREVHDYLRKHTGGSEGQGTRRGDVAEAMAAADLKLQRTYTVAYIAHTPLEPRAAVAEWQGGKLTVWTGTQRPFGVRSELASAFKIAEEQVRVIQADPGSGYGGKHTGEAALEAARLAKATGKPVRVVWTREEEFRWAYFRPAGIFDIASGASKAGVISAWEHHTYNAGGAGISTFYDIAHQRIASHSCQTPVRQGSYRALAATANHFARETHMDEIARELNIDPLELRLKNLKDERLRAVFQAAAERFGWGRKKAEGRGYGIAGGSEKGSYVAACVEASVPKGGGPVRIHRVVQAFECGAINNPEHLKNQVVGMIIMGLGGALFEAMEFENGRVTNARLSRYRVPRFSDVPPIDVVLLDRKDLASAGGGETPICAVAPALGNAIFDASGIRLRSMPLAPNGVKA